LAATDFVSLIKNRQLAARCNRRIRHRAAGDVLEQIRGSNLTVAPAVLSMADPGLRFGVTCRASAKLKKAFG